MNSERFAEQRQDQAARRFGTMSASVYSGSRVEEGVVIAQCGVEIDQDDRVGWIGSQGAGRVHRHAGRADAARGARDGKDLAAIFRSGRRIADVCRC